MNRLTHQGPVVNPDDNTATVFWRWDNAGDRTQTTTDVPGGGGGATASVYAEYTFANQLCWVATIDATGCSTTPDVLVDAAAERIQ